MHWTRRLIHLEQRGVPRSQLCLDLAHAAQERRSVCRIVRLRIARRLLSRKICLGRTNEKRSTAACKALDAGLRGYPISSSHWLFLRSAGHNWRTSRFNSKNNAVCVQSFFTSRCRKTLAGSLPKEPSEVVSQRGLDSAVHFLPPSWHPHHLRSLVLIGIEWGCSWARGSGSGKRADLL